MKTFDSRRLFQVLAPFDDNSLDLKRRFELVLEALMDIGYHSARFYLKIESGTVPQKDLIKLFSYKYQDRNMDNISGYVISFEDTTIFRNNDIRKGFSIGHKSIHSNAEWPHDLSIDGTNWVDLLVPGSDPKEIYGLLAVSWTGAPSLLCEQALSSLRLLATRISTWITQRSERIVHLREDLEDSFQIDQHAGAPTLQTLERIKDFLYDAFMAESVACFQYHWERGLLVKICERVKGVEYGQIGLKEIYRAGEHVTGKAFINSSARFIPDFEDVLKSKKEDIFEDSISYHKRLLGDIQSCLYQVISFGQKRYFFRLFRSTDSTHGFYSKKDRDDLLAACTSLSARLEREVREFQLIKIRQAATTGFQSLKSMLLEQSQLIDYMEACDISDYTICSYEDLDGSFDQALSRGRFARSTLLEMSPASDILGSISERTRRGELCFVLNRNSFHPVERKRQGISHELDVLGLKELQVLATKNVSGFTCLILGRSEIPVGTTDNEATGLPKNEEGFLLSLLSIYAAATEAGRSLISAERADSMLADLGHEVGTPVSILTQTAILACDESLAAIEELLKQSEPSPALLALRSQLDGYKLEVNDRGGLVQIITEIPRALAQIGTSHIEVDFKAYDWNELIKAVWRDAIDWSIILDERAFSAGRVSKGFFELKISENLAGLWAGGPYSYEQ